MSTKSVSTDWPAVWRCNGSIPRITYCYHIPHIYRIPSAPHTHAHTPSQGLFDAGTVQSMQWVVERVCGVLSDPVRSAVVMSGCGTSGRIAFLMAVSCHMTTT